MHDPSDLEKRSRIALLNNMAVIYIGVTLYTCGVIKITTKQDKRLWYSRRDRYKRYKKQMWYFQHESPLKLNARREVQCLAHEPYESSRESSSSIR